MKPHCSRHKAIFEKIGNHQSMKNLYTISLKYITSNFNCLRFANEKFTICKKSSWFFFRTHDDLNNNNFLANFAFINGPIEIFPSIISIEIHFIRSICYAKWYCIKFDLLFQWFAWFVMCMIDPMFTCWKNIIFHIFLLYFVFCSHKAFILSI